MMILLPAVIVLGACLAGLVLWASADRLTQQQDVMVPLGARRSDATDLLAFIFRAAAFVTVAAACWYGWNIWQVGGGFR